MISMVAGLFGLMNPVFEVTKAGRGLGKLAVVQASGGLKEFGKRRIDELAEGLNSLSDGAVGIR